MKRLRLPNILTIILIAWFFTGNAHAQHVTEDSLMHQKERLTEEPVVRPAFVQVDEKSVLELIDSRPSFGIYQDGYFITGIPTNRRIDGDTADVKFQLSIRQRLTQSILPLKTFLYLTFTQKSFWTIYKKSAPFKDNNYNPSISLGKVIILRNELKGTVSVALEHESNGRDSTFSRSWNFFSISAAYFFNPRFKIDGKIWIPFSYDRDNNPDIIKRRGIGHFAFHYLSSNERLWLTAQFNPVKKFGNTNMVFDVNYKVGMKSNQYLYLQFYSGFGESMMDYDRYSSMIRFGFCIKPRFMSVF